MAVTASGELLLSVVLSEVWGVGKIHRRDLLGTNRPVKIRIPNGAAAGELDVAYLEPSASISASGTATLALRGSRTDSEGNTINLATLKGLVILNTNTASKLSVFLPASNPVSGLLVGATDGTDGITVEAARSSDEPGIWIWVAPAGLTIGASTHSLTISNDDGSNAITPTIAFWGVST